MMAKKAKVRGKSQPAKQVKSKNKRMFWLLAGLVILLSAGGYAVQRHYQQKLELARMQDDLNLIYAQEMDFYQLALKSPTANQLYNWYSQHRAKSVIVNASNNGFNLTTFEPLPQNFFYVAPCRKTNPCFEKFEGDKGNLGMYRSDLNAMFIMESSSINSIYRAITLAHETKHVQIILENMPYPDQKAREYACYSIDAKIINELTGYNYQKAMQKQLNRYLQSGRNDIQGFWKVISTPELEADINQPGLLANRLDVELYGLEIWASQVHPLDKEKTIRQILEDIDLTPK